MQKLKNSVLDKMLKSHMTKAEVDFMLEVSHYQDDYGCVYGVYYKTVCRAIGVCPDTFYVVMENLEKKGLIRRSTQKGAWYGDWDIVIIGNDFSYPEAVREGYIDTGLKFFQNPSFRKLKAGEKILALQLLKITGANTAKRYNIGVKKFYSEWSKRLDVSKRTVQAYLGRLKTLFSIGIKDGEYWIRTLADGIKERTEKDIECLKKHLGEVSVRRNRTVCSEQSAQDVMDLIGQYANLAGAKIAKTFLDSVKYSIQLANEAEKRKYKWNRTLKPKLVHQILRDAIMN